MNTMTNATQYPAPPRSTSWIAYPKLYGEPAAATPEPVPASAPSAAAAPWTPAPPEPGLAQSRCIEEAITCPITLDIMADPVVAGDGHTYERQAISDWIDKKGLSPLTNGPLRKEDLKPNLVVRQLSASFVEAAASRAASPSAAALSEPAASPELSSLAPAASCASLSDPASPVGGRSVPARESAAPSAPPWTPDLAAWFVPALPVASVPAVASDDAASYAPSVPAVAGISSVSSVAPVPAAWPVAPVAPVPAAWPVAPVADISPAAPVSVAARVSPAPLRSARATPAAPPRRSETLAMTGTVGGSIAVARPAAVAAPTPLSAAPRAPASAHGSPERLAHLVKRPNDELHKELETVWSEYSQARRAFCGCGDARLVAWGAELRAAEGRASAAQGWSARRAAKADVKGLQERMARLSTVLADLRQHMTPAEGTRAAPGAEEFEGRREALSQVWARLQSTAKTVCAREAAAERDAEFMAKALHKGPARDAEQAKATKARKRVEVAKAILAQLGGTKGRR